MSAHTDFLRHKQPGADTVRALWYLHHFATEGHWENGFAFEAQLRRCRLDYTLGSLKRIDQLLDAIRIRLQPDAETFFQQPQNQPFLLTLAFYCGEMHGRLRQTAPVWRQYEQLLADFAGMENIFPYAPCYEFAACFDRTDGGSLHFPLAAIWARLFPEHGEADKSVYLSTLTGDHSAYGDDDPLPSAPPQHLAIDFQEELAATPATWLPYLQMLPPRWMHGDELMAQLRALPVLYGTGRVVWAALVQANEVLFDADNPQNSVAELIYDKSGRTPPHMLRQYAQILFDLKHRTPNDPELARYAAHIRNERTRWAARIPHVVTHMPVYSASAFIWRTHLPNGLLSLPVFPILIAEGTDEVTLLPAKYWAHTALYEEWLQQSGSEVLPAWAALLHKQPDPWPDYRELLFPQAEELGILGAAASAQDSQNKRAQADPSWVEHNLWSVQRDYPRSVEYSKLK